jgi:hypothetical protein
MKKIKDYFLFLKKKETPKEKSFLDFNLETGENTHTDPLLPFSKEIFLPSPSEFYKTMGSCTTIIGYKSTASSCYSTISSGYSSTASGSYSFGGHVEKPYYDHLLPPKPWKIGISVIDTKNKKIILFNGEYWVPIPFANGFDILQTEEEKQGELIKKELGL